MLASDRSNNISPPYWNTDIISITGHDFNNYDIYKLNINGSLNRLTKTQFNESSPCFSPDGSKIAYISDKSGINNIYITKDEFKIRKSKIRVQKNVP